MKRRLVLYRVPLPFLIPVLLLAIVPLGPDDGFRARLCGWLLLLGILVGAHFDVPFLREMVTRKGPYAVFFWTVVVFVVTMAVFACLEWIGWFNYLPI